MKEIGGYIELERFSMSMLHEGALALNSGRNALAYLIRARGIKRLLLPRFLCDSVPKVCEREGADYTLYDIGRDFLPAQDFDLEEGEWLYLVNYYSQLSNEQLAAFAERYGRVIVDNAQSCFQKPLPGVDTLCTCRKYFGVPDGAFLYTDAAPIGELPRDESFSRMGFLLGRFERTANEFYGDFRANEERFEALPVMAMSALTRNLLHGIDYAAVERRRRENFAYLHERLKDLNGLTLRETGTFMYPLLLENGKALRKKLQAEKIYIPTLWPDVFQMSEPGSTEYAMAENILPLPIDQRYTTEDMAYMLHKLEQLIKE